MIIPISRPNGTKFTIDLTDASKAEARIDEISGVTAAKAPELLACFNRAFLDTSKALSLMGKQIAETKRHLDRTKSRILLDKVPGILQQKGLATAKNPMGSEDMRQAVLDTDDDFAAAQQMLAEHECHYELIKGKLKGFEMAYGSVKRVLNDTPNGHGHRDNFNPPTAASQPGRRPSNGFGTARTSSG